MPSFNADLPDSIARRATPSEAVVGVLDATTSVEEFATALGFAGIDDARIHVLVGPAGIEVLRDLGTPFGRIFAPAKDKPIGTLEEGGTLVAVVEVTDDMQLETAEIMSAAGVRVVHRFGRWVWS